MQALHPGPGGGFALAVVVCGAGPAHPARTVMNTIAAALARFIGRACEAPPLFVKARRQREAPLALPRLQDVNDATVDQLAGFGGISSHMR